VEPDPRRGPTYALTVSDGRAAMCVLSGYRRTLALWEGRIPESGRRHLTWHAAEAVAFGSTSLVGRAAGGWASFELEVVLDDMPPSYLSELLRFCAGPVVADGIHDLADVGSLPISANQDLRVPHAWLAAGITAVDLRVSTMPSRRRERGSEVIFGSRWVRLIVTSRGFIALWAPIEGNWPPGRVRWPHFCLPSREAEWLRQHAIQPDLDGQQRLCMFLRDVLAHEEYFLNSWGLELELWEEMLYAQLVDVDSEVFGRLRFPELQRELGLLADYITSLRFNQRNLTRRADESRALSDPEARKLVKGAADRLGQKIDQSRGLLRHAFSLMSNAATGEQFYVARKQQQASERLQNTITFITVILLVPTLIAGVYGSNIRELSPSSRGTLPALLGAMAIGAVLAAAGLRWRQQQPLFGSTSRANVRMLGLGLAGACAAIAFLLVKGSSVAAWEFMAAGWLIVAYSGVRGIFLRVTRTRVRDNR
jgi:CorA-like Mg2+ transporter protein